MNSSALVQTTHSGLSGMYLVYCSRILLSMAFDVLISVCSPVCRSLQGLNYSKTIVGICVQSTSYQTPAYGIFMFNKNMFH